MKFILNENKRFILEERFTLNETRLLKEATEAEATKKWTDYFLKTLDPTEAVIKKYFEYAGTSKAKATTQTKLTEIKKGIEAFKTSLDLPAAELEAESTNLKAELDTVIKSLSGLDKVIKVTPELTSLQAKKIPMLTQLHAKPVWDAKDLKTLNQFIDWVNETILPLFNETDLDNAAQNVEKFKADCEACLKYIEQFRKDFPTNFTTFSTAEDVQKLKEYWLAIKQSAEAVKTLKDASSINKGLVTSNFATYQKQVETIKTSYTAITETAIFKQYSEESEAEHNRQEAERSRQELTDRPAEEKDWATKYAKAVDKMAVIEGFIYDTWKDNDGYKKVLKVKAAVAQECESYGFRPSKDDGKNGNPFINFISAVYLKYEDMTPATYNVIHNLVADKMLTGQDLVGVGQLEKSNLLFCKAFYRLEPAVAKLYLVKQYHLLHIGKKPDTFNSVEEMVFNMLYKLPELQLGDKFDKFKTEASTNLGLNSMNAIEDLEVKWVGEITKATIEDTDTKNKVIINAELLNQIGSTDNAVEVLATLALKFSSNENITKLVASCAEATSLMSKTTTITAIQKLVSRVERLYKLQTINATQALNLIKSIFESDKFELTKN